MNESPIRETCAFCHAKWGNCSCFSSGYDELNDDSLDRAVDSLIA